jgi:hypothetical protein
LQQWGINIVGKLTPSQGNYTFTIVAVEYFTKWVEAKPITNVSSATISGFACEAWADSEADDLLDEDEEDDVVDATPSI